MPGEPMEAAQRSAEYVFQGIMYYFRREKVCPRYQFTLKDPVDPALLQQALDAALEAAPYYRVRLVWEKRRAFLEPNSEPCLVYPDSVMREMPEQTNGYFFAVHCAQNTVYFDWFHFIADGHGVSPFLTRILELYCNLRYGTAFANPPIPCSPAYDIAKLVEQYPLQVMDETTMQREVVDTCEEPMHRIRIRFAKKDLVAKGVQNGVKPFCALMGLLCIALGEYLGKDTIQYSYSADTRDAMGAPNARYNCVCSFQDGVTLHEGVRLEEFVQQMDRAVKDSLTAERKRRKMADQMGWVYKVDQQKAPLRIKQRVFQMGEYISGIPADFWFSYLGNPLMPATPELEAVHHRFWRVGAAGGRLPVRGSLHPQRGHHPLHREQGAEGRPARHPAPGAGSRGNPGAGSPGTGRSINKRQKQPYRNHSGKAAFLRLIRSGPGGWSPRRSVMPAGGRSPAGPPAALPRRWQGPLRRRSRCRCTR